MTSRAHGFLIALAVLWAAVVAGLALPQNEIRSEARYLQRQWGGLGLGAHAAAGSCWFVFDPRIEPYCPNFERPFPALPNFCPRHSTTVSRLPVLTAYAREPRSQVLGKGAIETLPQPRSE